MKILIIGAKGFIGSHIANYFSGSDQVFETDVFENPSQKNYFFVNPENPNFEPLFENCRFDVCINASGNGSVPISITKPVFDFELNVFNTIKILDVIKKRAPECKFINLSSAAVYGNPVSLPVSESVELRPLSPYGWHKLYSEQVCKEYYYLYNIKTINLRLFSVYGEGLRKQLFWDLYQKCIHSENVELFGSGNETRDFIYITDLLKAIECVIHGGLFNGESINVASGYETSISSAASIFIREINPKITLKFNMLVKPGDPLNWRANIGIIKSLGFEPITTIEDGLLRTTKWLKENA